MLIPRGRAVGGLDHRVITDEMFGGEDVMVLAGVWIWSSMVSPNDELALTGYWGNSSEEEPEPSESGLGISGCCMMIIPCDGPREHVWCWTKVIRGEHLWRCIVANRMTRISTHYCLIYWESFLF